MFKLQYYRVSAPTELLVADRDTSDEPPFAYTQAPAGEQAAWSSAYRWLQGGAEPAQPPSETPEQLLQVIDQSDDEVQRVGAGYQLGEHVAAASSPDDAAATASAMLALMEDANTPVEPDSLPGGAEPRGQHGCRESVLRALQYGLMNAGSAAVPTLLRVIESADLSTGQGANIVKRALHALGEAATDPDPAMVAAVVRVVHECRATIDGYVGSVGGPSAVLGSAAGPPELFDPAYELEADKESDGFNTQNRLRDFGGAGVIQQEPQDMYGAELHYLAATAQQVTAATGRVGLWPWPRRLTVDRCCEQCLGALAESAVRNADVATAAAIADVFVETLNIAEDGWMFEARQGCAA